MHINVSDILNREVGQSVSFKVADERPVMADIKLSSPLNGELRLIRTDFGLAGEAKINGQLELECHRCLNAFSHAFAVTARGEFARSPEAEQWAISGDNVIDIAPMVRQEVLLNLPIKLLCEADCPGLCEVCGERGVHEHAGKEQATSRIRIVKGNK